jgi:hypothetical protein
MEQIPTNDSQRSGSLRIATPGQDRYTRVFHLRNRTVAASTTAGRRPIAIFRVAGSNLGMTAYQLSNTSQASNLVLLYALG